MIKISNLTKKYNNDVVALNGVTLSVDKGDIYGIIGLSGAGKSTLVRCINLLEQPTSGTIEIDGVDLTKLSKKDLRVKRKEISMIFQNFNLLQQKNVLQNVLFPLQISNNDKQYSLKKAKDLLKMVDLSDKLDSYPSQLSGGQKQRVAIARALATKPEVILFDEPTSALDPSVVNDLLELLDELSKTTTIVVVSHEMDLIKNYADKVLFLKDKGILAYGDKKEILNSENPKVQEFLGKSK